MLPLGLLWWHVVWRAENLTGEGHIRVVSEVLGQPKIRHVRLAMAIDQNIRRLQVAVQDALFVRIVNGFGDGLDPGSSLAGRDRLLAIELTQVLALDVVHREVVEALMFAHFMDANDVRMVKPRRRGSLRLEPLQRVRTGELTCQDHLHCDRAIEADLACLVDDTHAAPVNFMDKLVVAKAGESCGRLR